MKLKAYFDGSCGPINPGGTASYGFVIYRDREIVRRGRGIIGTGPTMTNNVAEAVAASELIRCVLNEFKDATEVWIYGDSDIVIRQMNGKGNKRPRGFYGPYVKTTRELAMKLRARCFASFEWIPRAENSEADKLADFGNAHWSTLRKENRRI